MRNSTGGITLELPCEGGNVGPGAVPRAWPVGWVTAPARPIFKFTVFMTCACMGTSAVAFLTLTAWPIARATVDAVLYWGVVAYALAEILFTLAIYVAVLPAFNTLVRPPTPLSSTWCLDNLLRTVTTVKQLRDDVGTSSYSIQRLVSGFFKMAAVQDIYLEDYHSFFAYAMHGKDVKDATVAEMDQVPCTLSTSISLYLSTSVTPSTRASPLRYICV